MTAAKAWLVLLIAVIGAQVAMFAGEAGSSVSTNKFHGVLLNQEQATPRRLKELIAKGTNPVVLALDDSTVAQDCEAAKRIRAFGLALYYWIEIGRCPLLADAHPEWMASLQGHPEWRRFFPNLPAPKEGEVVKNYPWVPVLYRESFAAHLERVKKLLAGAPLPAGVFLNDLQGGPSACGCGNPLCRWTADYGPIQTATPLGDDAAARFVAEVKKLAPSATIFPVWTTECEEHDREGLCAGVGCYQGTCWKKFAAQVTPLAGESPLLGVLLPFRSLGRDLPRYGPTAGWITCAVQSFGETPQGVRLLPPQRLLAVLQGWDVTPERVQAQIERSNEAGTAGYLLSLLKIKQRWEPRIVKVSAESKLDR